MRHWFLSLCFLVMLPSKLLAGGVVLTFDDWFVDQWHDFFIKDMRANHPEVNVRATFFVSHWLSDLKGVNQGRIGNSSHYVKLKQLEDAGHEIAVHGLHHVGVDDAPYRYQPEQANAYYANEVAPAIRAMLDGDPGVAGDYGFIPKSFAYPYGARTAAYDKVIKDNGIRYLRGTSEIDPNLPMSANDAIYHRSTDVRSFLIGDGIDKYYQNSVAEVEAALQRAKNNNEIITLYAHRILPDGSPEHNFGLYASQLKAIILKAHQLGLRFYRFNEAFQEGGISGGGSGSGGANADKISVTVEVNNRVRLSWVELANTRIDIALAGQPEMPLASATTNGAATGKIGITVANAQAGQQYVAVFYFNNTKVATSNPFVMAVGSGGGGSGGVSVAAPTNLLATAVASNRVDLAWTDNSSNETAFRLGRCVGSSCSNFTELGSVAANVTRYTDNTVQPNTTYRYRVLAYSDATASTSYPVATVVTPAAAAALTRPTQLTTTSLGGGQIRLMWADTNTSEQGFSVERCIGSSCIDFAEIATVGVNVLNFTDTNLIRGTTYRYQVRAFNASGVSPYSTRSRAVAH